MSCTTFTIQVPQSKNSFSKPSELQSSLLLYHLYNNLKAVLCGELSLLKRKKHIKHFVIWIASYSIYKSFMNKLSIYAYITLSKICFQNFF